MLQAQSFALSTGSGFATRAAEGGIRRRRRKREGRKREGKAKKAKKAKEGKRGGGSWDERAEALSTKNSYAIHRLVLRDTQACAPTAGRALKLSRRRRMQKKAPTARWGHWGG